MLPVMRTSLFLILLCALLYTSCEDSDGTTAGSLTGKGGSLARFAATSTHLYSVDDETLKVYQFMKNGALEKINELDMDAGVETVSAKDHWLYIGTRSAMIIYDIINPANPTYVSSYSHLLSCDPVVVQDSLAYVTLRTTNCRSVTTNTLEIINIKNPYDPHLLSSYTLLSPYGLGVDGDLAFICEGNNGLTVLDVSNPFNAVLLRRYTDAFAYDVITNKGTLIVTGEDGIVQYNYTDNTNIKKISTIPVLP